MNYILDSRGFFVEASKAKLKPGQRFTNSKPPSIPDGYKAKWDGDKWTLVCMVPKTPQEAKAQRQRMLASTDWTMLEDSPLSASEKEKYKKYRKALRDLTESELWPNVVWPKISDFEKPAPKKRGPKTKKTEEE